MVDVSPTRPRRSSAEAAKDKSDRAEQSKNDDEELQNKRKAVAELEDAMFVEENTRQASAAKPVRGPVTAKVPRPVAQTQNNKDAPGSEVGVGSDEDIEINDDVREHDDSEDFDGVASSPHRAKKAVKPKKKRGDQRALIEQSRLTNNKMGDLFAATALDTSKRKLINQDAQLENQPASKKIKPALPSGLLPAGSASRVNPSFKFSKPSNLPKTPAVKKPVAAHDPDFTSRYGGILDSELVDSAPPVAMEKAKGKRPNIAKIHFNAPAAKIEAMEAVMGGRPRAVRKKEIYNQTHLPEGTLQAWKTHIISAWRDFAGAQENPWNTTMPELCDDLKEIWDIVYPTRAHQVIVMDGPIFTVATQRWYEWRSTIGRAVLLAVNVYMEEFSDDVDARAAHAIWMKGDDDTIPFTWKDHPLSAEEPQVFKGLFLSYFVLVGLAAHLNMTSSVCPELEVDSEPRGALVIATVGVERAFNFWITGISTAGDPDRKEDAKFSEDNWGLSTLGYIDSISKLTPRQWKKINDAATELMEKPKQPVSLIHGANAYPLNARGSLFEEDSEPEE